MSTPPPILMQKRLDLVRYSVHDAACMIKMMQDVEYCLVDTSFRSMVTYAVCMQVYTVSMQHG